MSATALTLLLTAGIMATVAPAAEPDTAPRGDTMEQIHGFTIHDPYRWMEHPHNAEFSA